jgi:TolB-like protein/Tfp pilus assembly protein PilF
MSPFVRTTVRRNKISFVYTGGIRMPENNQPQSSGAMFGEGRLDSWKEIAAYTRKTVRTVQRWERSKGLPVHRHGHGKNGSIYAFTADIDRWLRYEPEGDRKDIHSVVVLPLHNLSDDPAQECFADGMTESLIIDLGKIRALRVISRASAMRYKTLCKSPLVIAKELNVDGIVQGTVLQVGKRVRITAKLIHAPTSTQVWAESYERDIRDVLALYREVARAIADEISVKLFPLERAHFNQERRVAPEAHVAYLRGRYFWNKRTPDSLRKSMEYLQCAIQLDPHYALAHAGLADAYAVLGSVFLDSLPPREAMPKALQFAAKALKLDTSLGEAYVTTAYIRCMYHFDWAAAEEVFQRAIAYNPGYSVAHEWYAIYLALSGRKKEALDEIGCALDTDPLSLQINTASIQVQYFLGDYDKAIDCGLKTLDLDPSFSTASIFLAMAYQKAKLFKKALKEAQKAATFSPDKAAILGCIGGCYASLGEENEAFRIIKRLKQLARRRYVPAFVLAWIYMNLRIGDKTVEYLEQAYAERSSYLSVIGVEPGMNFIRGDARFKNLQSNIGLPQHPS